MEEQHTNLRLLEWVRFFGILFVLGDNFLPSAKRILGNHPIKRVRHLSLSLTPLPCLFEAFTEVDACSRVNT